MEADPVAREARRVLLPAAAASAVIEAVDNVRSEDASRTAWVAASAKALPMDGIRPDERATLDSLIDAWRTGDALRAAAHFTLDGEYAEARGTAPLVGRDALVAHFTRFFRDGPRCRFDVDDVIVEGKRACVVYRFAVEGTGALWRERAGCAIVKFDPNGAVAAWREYEG